MIVINLTKKSIIMLQKVILWYHDRIKAYSTIVVSRKYMLMCKLMSFFPWLLAPIFKHKHVYKYKKFLEHIQKERIFDLHFSQTKVCYLDNLQSCDDRVLCLFLIFSFLGLCFFALLCSRTSEEVLWLHKFLGCGAVLNLCFNTILTSGW